MKTLIIIPAYNEAQNILSVAGELVDGYPQYDFVVVNDGSRDDTASVCKNAGFSLIDLPVNIGLTGGVQAGMRYAQRMGYDYAVQLDGDGQHDPAYISELLSAIQSDDLDFVIGSRFVGVKKPLKPRMIGSLIISLAIFLTTGKKISDPTSGMRLYNKRLIKLMANSMDLGPEPDTLAYLIRSGAKFCEVPVIMKERSAGESYLNFSRAFRYMVDILFSIILLMWVRKKNIVNGDK
ncbi:MAG: glycosyltransferase family 2 protein [Oscillospiraceae bacterium]|nr:glycosyltransferase family 2 protein [Oscillospiraceae bacterium]